MSETPRATVAHSRNLWVAALLVAALLLSSLIFYSAVQESRMSNKTVVIVQVPKLYAKMTLLNVTTSSTVNASRMWLQFNFTGGRPYVSQGLDEWAIHVDGFQPSFGVFGAGVGSDWRVPNGFRTSYLIWGSRGNITFTFVAFDQSDNCFGTASQCSPLNGVYLGQTVELKLTVIL